MKKTSSELFFKWFEDVWAHDDPVFTGISPDRSRAASGTGDVLPMTPGEFRRANPVHDEALTDIRLDFESFESNGDQVTCALVVKARNKISNEPVAFRAKFDGRVRDGELVGAANAVDYLLAE